MYKSVLEHPTKSLTFKSRKRDLTTDQLPTCLVRTLTRQKRETLLAQKAVSPQPVTDTTEIWYTQYFAKLPPSSSQSWAHITMSNAQLMQRLYSSVRISHPNRRARLHGSGILLSFPVSGKPSPGHSLPPTLQEPTTSKSRLPGSGPASWG